MIGSFKAEWRKLRQRPAVLVLLGLMVVGVALVLYVIPHFEYGKPGFQDSRTGLSGAQLKQGLYPAAFLNTGLQAILPDGALVALLVGALGLGSDFGWGTLKTILIQRPGRAVSLAGRATATGLLMAVVIIATYGAAAVASLSVALADRHAVTWPSGLETVEVMAASWLVLMCFGMTGMVLAALLRNATLAIGAGIFYMLILESYTLDLLKPVWTHGVNVVEKALPVINASSVLVSFGAPPGQHFPAAVVDVHHAVVVLSLWILTLAALTTFLLRRRDIS